MPVDLLPIPKPDLPEWSKIPELKQRLKFVVIDGLEDPAELVDGVWPSTNPDGPIQVAIHNDLANKSFFNVGNRYTLTNGVEIEISGIWQEIDLEDPFFYDEPQFHFGDLMWVPIETFETRVSKMLAQPIRYASWYILVGEDQIQFQRAGQYTKGMLRLDNDLRNLTLPVKMDYSGESA